MFGFKKFSKLISAGGPEQLLDNLHLRVFTSYLKLTGFSDYHVKTSVAKLHTMEKKVSEKKDQLVFVHGLGASLGHYSKIMVPLADAGYSISALDLPSHGKSSDAAGPLSFELLFKAFSEWVDQVVPGKFVLIGNSLGGALSFLYAVRNPHRVSQLILISPAGGFETLEDFEEFAKTLQFRTVEDAAAYINKLYHKQPFFLPLFYRSFFRMMNRKAIRELLDGFTFESQQVDLTIPEDFPRTLLIWGQSEKVFPSKNLEWFRKRLPQTVMIECPSEVGHCPQLENSKWTQNRIREFLEGSNFKKKSK